MREHPSSEQLQLYVLDALSEGEALTVELHVSECRPCTRRLAREASLELALGLIAEGGFSSSRDGSSADEEPVAAILSASHAARAGRHLQARASWRWVGGLGVAMAMCALLWLGPARADDRLPDGVAGAAMNAARDAEGRAPVAVDHLDGG